MQRARNVLLETVYDPVKDPDGKAERVSDSRTGPAIEMSLETVPNAEMEVEILMDSDLKDCHDNYTEVAMEEHSQIEFNTSTIEIQQSETLVESYEVQKSVPSNTDFSTKSDDTFDLEQPKPTLNQAKPMLCIDVDGTISIKNQSNTTPNTPELSKGTATKNEENTIQQTHSSKGPMVVQVVNKDKLQEMMKSHKLKLVDINSPLYKKLSQTMQQVTKDKNKETVKTQPTDVPINEPPKKSGKIATFMKPSNTQKIAQHIVPQQMKKPLQIVQTSEKTVKPPQLPPNPNLQGSIDELKKYIKAQRLKNKSLRCTADRLKTRLSTLKSLKTHKAFVDRLQNLSPAVRRLIEMQYKNAGVSPLGYRFTEKEKKFAFSLYNKDPNGYNFLREIGYILPQKKTVRTYIKDENISGCTSTSDIVERLKLKVRNMSPSHRLCSVMFDEKLLNAANMKKSVIDQEDSSVELYADHALVFVVKGIFKFYQVPVSYVYSMGPTSGTLLAEHLKKIIADLQSIGFKVLASICDHAENNRRAIETLINEARCDFLLTGDQYNDNVFVVNDQPIVAMYDPLHLIKGLRNHFISKDLSFVMNGTNKTATWVHLQMMFTENPEYKGKGLVNKLTEKHVYPDKIGMSKTKLATQVFSQSVSSYMRFMAEKGILPPESQDTADLLLFFDQLFDSFNGYMANTHKKGKPLLNACRLDTEHHKKWDESLETLKTMTFIENGEPVETAEIECWIWTIRSIKLLMKKLLKEYNLPLVWTRNFNQEAVERVFRVEVNPVTKPKTETEKEAVTREDFTSKVIKGISRVNIFVDKITPEPFG